MPNPHTPEEWAAQIHGVDVSHITEEPKFCGDGMGGDCLAGDCEIVNTVQALHAYAEQVRREEREALEESVKLQSHYAACLNQYDGGQRILFKDAEEWKRRLAMSPEERVKDAARRAREGTDV